MTLLRVNAHGDRVQLHEPARAAVGPALARALGDLPPGAPVAILIHGYKFTPWQAAHDPHTHIFGLDRMRRCRKARSWPDHLGFSADNPADGLCIAFGWDAKTRIDALGLPAVHARSPLAAAALGRLLDMIGAIAPDRPVDLVGHSLGCHVALRALAALTRPVSGRAILMAAAAYRDTARAALANPATARLEVINVTSRENDLYDALFRAAVPPLRPRDRLLGQGLPDAPAGWVDFPIDCRTTLGALARAGIHVAPRNRRACHWSFYLRPGIFDLYRALIRNRGAWPAARLRAVIADPACQLPAEATDLPVFVPLPTARAS
jgi:pimeloyl-ACP methyl ester carboxylesterase